MKRLLILIALLVGLTAQAAVFSTNVTSTLGGVFLLFTNRASIYSVELTSPYAASVDFLDCDNIAQPFYGTNSTNAAWVSRIIYPTNYVTSFIGYNGYTNWYTNASTWVQNTTNAAATNVLNPLLSFVVGGNTYAVYNTDALFTRGVCIRVTTNVTVTINYKSAM